MLELSEVRDLVAHSRTERAVDHIISGQRLDLSFCVFSRAVQLVCVIQEAAIRFIEEHAEQILDREEFLDISKERLLAFIRRFFALHVAHVDVMPWVDRLCDLRMDYVVPGQGATPSLWMRYPSSRAC